MAKFIHSPEISAACFAEFERLMGDNFKGWHNSSWGNNETDTLTFEAENPENDNEVCEVAILYLPDGDLYPGFYYHELDADVEGEFDTIEEAVKFILTRGLNALL